MESADNSLLNIKSENESLKREISKLRIEKQQAEKLRDTYLYELTETRNSKTYKITQKITAFHNKIGKKNRTAEDANFSQEVRPYMLSVVIAVYNTHEFLADMIESIIVQKTGKLNRYLKMKSESSGRAVVYDEMMELILVDDGSTDGSGIICDKYAEKYNWIKVLHKTNEGVSAARNAGIELASGKYITFPDSDDKLSDNCFQDCLSFFEEHEKEVALVTYPLRFFDGQTGEHWTTYRFAEGTRIIDMQEEWDKPQYITAASLFKTADLKHKILYDRNLINGEDIKLVHEVMFGQQAKIGLISECTYWYRRRSTGNLSAVQQSKFTEKYYIPYLTDMLGWMMRTSKEAYGKVPKYVQYAVMGQLQWRLKSDGDGSQAREIIGEEGFEEYRRLIKEMISQIDMDVILTQKCLDREHLFYAASVHTNGVFSRVYEEDNLIYYFENKRCTDLASCYVKLEFMKIENHFLYLEGVFANLEPEVKNWIQIGSRRYELQYYERSDVGVRILDEMALYANAFHITIPLEELKSLDEDNLKSMTMQKAGAIEDAEIGKYELSFVSEVAGYEIVRTNIKLGKFMPLTKQFSWSYYSENHWTVRLTKHKLMIWDMLRYEKFLDFETDFQKQVSNSKVGKKPEIMNALEIRKAAVGRKGWQAQSGDSRDRIWLISDRYSVADDNGEALFLYLTQKKLPNIQVYFVIDKESPDFERLSSHGNILAQDSKEHLLMFMLADVIISSQADEYIINPLWRQGLAGHVFRDFYCRQKFVFLQHGVIKDDLSRWLNRFNKNIDGFVCAAHKEAQSILDYNYHYKPENVWLTGLPRYDRLYHNEKKHIMVMPTWRKWLMQDFNAADSDKDATHVREDIEKTEFYDFYHDLLNNSRLLNACDEYGYKLCFMPHTNLREAMDKFCEDERVNTYGLDIKYRDAFARADLLITDYSSTAMDFAYLRKPVLYAQFDKEQFFSGEHTYDKGYFEYEEDGFGEVFYDVESLIDTVISYMQSGCQLKEPYRKRIDDFFAYDDKNNCERIYQKILQLTEG